jgi:hypothetical protein
MLRQMRHSSSITKVPGPQIEPYPMAQEEGDFRDEPQSFIGLRRPRCASLSCKTITNHCAVGRLAACGACMS